MPCEHYKDALTEAAAAGAAPQGELRAHLDECASCRVTFDEAQSLFVAMDSGLRTAVNTEVPPSFLPRVRARLDEAAAPRLRWVQPLVFCSASLALALGVFLLARPRHAAPEEAAKQGPAVVQSPAAVAAKANLERISPEGTQIVAVRVGHSRASRNSTNPHSVASGNPEVLVPPDEREGLAQLVATLNQRRDLAAFLAQRPEKKDALVMVDPLRISDLEIKPLEGTKTDTSDGVGEKQ